MKAALFASLYLITIFDANAVEKNDNTACPQLEDVAAAYTKNIDGAIISCTKMIESFPLSHAVKADLHNRRGRLFLKQSQFSPALDDFKSSIILDPSNPGARLNMAVALNKLGKWNDAEKGINFVLRHYGLSDFGFFVAYKARGDANLDLHRYDKAIDDYSTALKMRPTYYRLLLLRGSAYHAKQDTVRRDRDFEDYSRLRKEADKTGKIDQLPLDSLAK